MSQILPSQDELLAHAAAEPAFAAWLQGHGPLQHSAETRAAVFRTAHQLVQAGLQPDLASVYQLSAPSTDRQRPAHRRAHDLRPAHAWTASRCRPRISDTARGPPAEP